MSVFPPTFSASSAGFSFSSALAAVASALPMTGFLLRGVPAADLDLADLGDGADPRPELLQVVAPDELDRIVGSDFAVAGASADSVAGS